MVTATDTPHTNQIHGFLTAFVMLSNDKACVRMCQTLFRYVNLKKQKQRKDQCYHLSFINERLETQRVVKKEVWVARIQIRSVCVLSSHTQINISEMSV